MKSMQREGMTQSMSEILSRIDAQIKAREMMQPAGDRRRVAGTPPEGIAERRVAQDRRNRGR